MIRQGFLLIAIISGLCFTGCYQSGSDDDLRTVPVTNNPNILPDGGRIAQMPGLGY